MISNIYCVYDEKAGAYLQPWFLPTDGMALRAFADCVNDGDHNFGRHPHDYSLFRVGEFDDATARIVSPEILKSMGNGVEFIEFKAAGSQETLDFVQPDLPVERKAVDLNEEDRDA